MSGNPMFQSNPLLHHWMNAANTAAGAWQGVWTAEFARQQMALMVEFNRQALRVWTGAWALPSRPAPAPRPDQASAPGVTAASVPAAATARLVEAATPAPELPIPAALAAEPAPAPAVQPEPLPATALLAQVPANAVLAQATDAAETGPATAPQAEPVQAAEEAIEGAAAAPAKASGRGAKAPKAAQLRTAVERRAATPATRRAPRKRPGGRG